MHTTSGRKITYVWVEVQYVQVKEIPLTQKDIDAADKERELIQLIYFLTFGFFMLTNIEEERPQKQME